ncbi:Beta-galactosidase [Oopsacas minuta]|uniref:Beta-galactosidase n=1 Tax=Oopsacas minuta TaxID=111878 RepID=A0AAV7K985_9METZ|nr:Beta-galactosidase [Oopsacas minuta]
MVNTILFISLCLSFACHHVVNSLSVELDQTTLAGSDPSFVPDFNNRYFLKDGKPFRYISGIFHYTRVLPQYWALRLRQMKAAGLDAVQTYVFWNIHEPRPGVYDFDGNHNIIHFIKLAQQVGLLVILRIGPYVCAEWDLGGMPSWLLTHKDIMLRSKDTVYMSYVYNWLHVILPKIHPFLYSKGGPIIMLQYENEYGSFGGDKTYLSNLVEYFNNIIPAKDVTLFSTDGNSYSLLKRGSLTNSLLATIDFGIGTNVQNSVNELRKYSYGTPFVNSEFYTGWPDVWGGEHQKRPTEGILSTLNAILDANGSVCFYMFSGGTNFGFMNGAMLKGSEYSPWITSYDYDSPISEGGDLTEKYYAIRKFIANYRNVILPNPPVGDDKVTYGKVTLQYYGNIFHDYKDSFKIYTVKTPVPMEFFNQSYGYILYETVFETGDCKSNLTTTVNLSIQDRGHFYVNSELITILDRKSTNVTFHKNCSITMQVIQIMVENMGRINYQHRSVVNGDSTFNHEHKGIIQFQSDELITSWMITSFDFHHFMHDTLKRSEFYPEGRTQYCFYQGELPKETGTQKDTYVHITSPPFSKGVVFINNFNLGRFWPAKGPQKSLYIPGVLFKTHSTNYITLFETDNCIKSTTDTTVDLRDVPDLG